MLFCAGAVMCLLASPTAAQQARGLGQAKSALLKKSDFPPGWSARGSGNTSNGSSNSLLPGGTYVLQQFESCIGASPAMQNALSPPGVASPLFVSGASVVESAVGVYSNAHMAQQGYAMLSSSKAPVCMSAAEQNPFVRKYLNYEALQTIENLSLIHI